MNLIRTLIYDGQVSLTLADTTELVKEGAQRHALQGDAAKVLGKALSVAAFLSAALKNDRGDISFSIEGNGKIGSLQAAGNRALAVRGYLQNGGEGGSEEELLGSSGSLTVVRDDGYSRPFVGSCDFPERPTVERLFERYFSVSEQLPTYLSCVVKTGADGQVNFAGIAALQPLPFTDEKTVEEMPKGAELEKIVAKIEAQGIEKVAKDYFSAKSDGIEERKVAYKCKCSREYLAQVLVTLGKPQLTSLLAEEGQVSAHCAFCNTDYIFTPSDIDEIFKK